MYASTSYHQFNRGTIAWSLSCSAVTLFVAAVVAAAQRGGDPTPGGADSYTPRRGEWLCVLLNARQALSNSERVPREFVVHYFYDRSRPNVILVQVLADRTSNEAQVRRCVARAEERAIATARIYGWQNWLRVEHREREFTDASAAESLVH
ncbi:MAG: hypothetical protein ACLP9L_08175 [Thermoguttaceae bacterium]